MILLTVGPMWIGHQPTPETVATVSGRIVQLLCPVQGVPTPTVTWSFSKGIKRQFYNPINQFN